MSATAINKVHLPLLALFFCIRVCFGQLVPLSNATLSNVQLKAIFVDKNEPRDVPPRTYEYDGNPVKEFIVGNGSSILEIWCPYGITRVKDGICVTVAQAAREFVLNNPDYTVILRKKDWPIVEQQALKTCHNRTLNEECPDILMLGTTHFTTRKDDTVPLEDYISMYFQHSGLSIRDEMTKGCFYDYLIQSELRAIPLVSDIRVLLHNKTFFDSINFPLPESSFSHGFGGSWTWEAFTDLVLRMHQASPLNRIFLLNSGFGEEVKLLVSMMISWGMRMFNIREENTYCGLKEPSFLKKYEETILKMYKAGAMAYCTRANSDPVEFQKCSDVKTYAIEYSTIKDLSVQTGNSTVVGYVPGQKTFLGGSGLAMTKITKNRIKTWELMTYIFDLRREYLTQIGLAASSPPPYDFTMNSAPWNSSTWSFPVNSLRTAVPIQWPDETFPQVGQLEQTPVQHFMYNTLYLNMGLQEAARNACTYFEDAFAKPCTEKDYHRELSSCFGENLLNITSSWNNSRCPVNNQYVTSVRLPDVITYQCNYVMHNSSWGAGMLFFSSFGIFACFCYMFGLYYYQDHPMIKASSPRFNQMFLLGSVLIHSSVIARIGKDAPCTLHVWLFSHGFVLVFGSAVVKLYRIYSVFNRSKTASKNFLKDIHLFYILGLMALIETVLLIAYQTVGKPERRLIAEQTDGVNFDVERCSDGNVVVITLLFVYNGLLVLSAFILSLLSRNAPPMYRESKFLGYISYASAFAVVVIVPVINSFSSSRPQFHTGFALYALTANFMTLSCTSIFSVSKIYSAYLHKSAQGSKTTETHTLPNLENEKPNNFGRSLTGTQLEQFYSKNFDTSRENIVSAEYSVRLGNESNVDLELTESDLELKESDLIRTRSSHVPGTQFALGNNSKQSKPQNRHNSRGSESSLQIRENITKLRISERPSLASLHESDGDDNVYAMRIIQSFTGNALGRHGKMSSTDTNTTAVNPRRNSSANTHSRTTTNFSLGPSSLQSIIPPIHSSNPSRDSMSSVGSLRSPLSPRGGSPLPLIQPIDRNVSRTDGIPNAQVSALTSMMQSSLVFHSSGDKDSASI